MLLIQNALKKKELCY